MGRLVVILLLLLSFPLSAVADQRQDRLKRRWLRDKPPITSISVKGCDYFSQAEIVKRMYSRKRSIWATLKGDRRTRIQRESLGRDTLEIKYLYLVNGFLGVRVQEAIEVVTDDSSAHVVVTIHEGRRYVYGATRITGSFEERLRGEFHNVGGDFKSGEKVNLLDLRRAVFDMKTVLANEGYPYGSVNFVLDTSDGDTICPITFEVTSDSLVHFGDVTITGVERYPRYTVTRESRIRSGDVYRRKTIIDSQRRLLESGYFSTARITRADTVSDRLYPDFVLRVRERKPMYATFTTGAGQSATRDLEWDFSTGFGKRNFLGSRRYDLSAQLKFGVGGGRGLLEHAYRIRYTEPWFLGTRMPLMLSARYEPGVKDPELNYRIESWSLSASTTRNFGQEYKTNLGLEYEAVRIFGVPFDEAALLKDEEGISVRRKIYFIFRRDSRDHIFVPRRGSLADFAGEYCGGFLGGDDHFSKFEANWSSYQPMWPGWISATRFKVGWANAFGASDRVPLDDRFYLGGANTVRGFKVNTLGPMLPDGTLEKANFIALFNQEFRWQTFQVFQFLPVLKDVLGVWPLWQSVFFDMGNGYRKAADISFRNLAYSYGTGVQIVSPAGPIRIDYARRIKTETIDFDSYWHFTILYAF